MLLPVIYCSIMPMRSLDYSRHGTAPLMLLPVLGIPKNKHKCRGLALKFTRKCYVLWLDWNLAIGVHRCHYLCSSMKNW